MAFAKPTQLTSWSFSRYSTYKQCPLRAKLLYLEKLPEPKNPAMDRGNTIHQLAEQFVKGALPRLPAELKAHGDLFKRLKAKRKKMPDQVLVEDTWAFTKDWSRTVWNDWTGCVLRIKMDCAELTVPGDGAPALTINDWKTGKFSPQYNVEDYLEQLQLYALGALKIFGAQHPGLRVLPRLVYLDAGVMYPDYTLPETKVYTVADLVPLTKAWEKKVTPLLRDKTFAPRPSDKCRWCHFSQAKGGPCKF